MSHDGDHFLFFSLFFDRQVASYPPVDMTRDETVNMTCG